MEATHNELIETAQKLFSYSDSPVILAIVRKNGKWRDSKNYGSTIDLLGFVNRRHEVIPSTPDLELGYHRAIQSLGEHADSLITHEGEVDYIFLVGEKNAIHIY